MKGCLAPSSAKLHGRLHERSVARRGRAIWHLQGVLEADSGGYLAAHRIPKKDPGCVPISMLQARRGDAAAVKGDVNFLDECQGLLGFQLDWLDADTKELWSEP